MKTGMNSELENKMPKCIRCERPLVRKVAEVDGVYAQESFRVKTDALVCPNGHYATVPAEHLDEYYKLVADAYRHKHGLLTSTAIRSLRLKMKMTQQEFADFLKVGVASIKRWELGQVQDRPYDELIRLKTDFDYASDSRIGILIHQGWPADEYSGFREFSAERFEQSTLFFLERLSKVIGKSKETHMALLANKLLWFSDIGHYRRFGESITGLRYARINRGPVPEDYRLLFKLLDQDKAIKYRNSQTLVPLKSFSPESFTHEEVDVLTKTWEHYARHLDKLEDLSHEEKACKSTPMYQLISFKKVEKMKR